MKRFLKSPLDRAMLLILFGQVLFMLWLGPDIRRAAGAYPLGSRQWGVALFLMGIGLTLYSLLESMLDDSA